MEPFISLHEPLHPAQEDTDSDWHTDSLAPQPTCLSNSEAAQKDREDSKEIDENFFTSHWKFVRRNLNI